MYYRDNNGKIIVEGYNNQNMPTSISNNVKTILIVAGVLLSLALLAYIVSKLRMSSYTRSVPYFLQ